MTEEVVRASDPLEVSLSPAECEAHREHIGAFVADVLAAAGAEEAVIGLSGGVDSTLTAHLAVEALGREDVYGLVMPSEVTDPDNTTDGERVADDLLGIESDVVEIAPIVEACLEAYPGPEDDPVVVGNLRVRARAVLTYLAANRRDALVLGTGNRSEALVGYFTKYGDGAVDCHPIGNLYKGHVRDLARHVGVPEPLAAKPASAEMWVGQTDEGELGLDYPTLDSILAIHVEGGLSRSATAGQLGVPEDAVDRVREMHERSAHKRTVPPSPDPL